VTYTRDGKLLASGSEDGSIILWEVSSHKQIGRLTGHLGTVTSLSFSADGTTLASGGTDRIVILWNVKSRKQIERLTGHRGSVTSVAFSADGTLLATGSVDGTVILWNGQSHKQIGMPLPGGIGEIGGLGFSPDSKLLALAGFGRTVIWDMQTATRPPVKTLPNSSTHFAFSPDSRTIALAKEATIALYYIASAQEPMISPPAPGKVESIAFSPDGGSVAAGFSDNSVVVYNVGNNPMTEQKRLLGHLEAVKSVAFNPAGVGLASGSRDGDLILWDPRSESRIRRTITGVSAAADSIAAFSPDSKVLVSGNSDGTVSFWNVATAKLVAEPIACHSKKVTSLAFSPDGTILASGSEDQTVVLLDVGSRRRLGQLKGHRGSVSYVGFSRDGRSLISSSQDGDTQSHYTVLFWNVPSGTGQRDAFSLTTNKALAFAPDSGHLAFVEGEEKVVLRAITSNGGVGQSKELKKDHHRVNTLVFSPDGKILASHTRFVSDLMSESWISNKPAILLWDTEAREAPGILRDYAFSGVMTFSPNALLLAAAGQGISLWDVSSRKQVGALMEGEDITGLAFSPDGRTLAAIQDKPKEIQNKGTEDRGIALWDVGTSELVGWLPAGAVSSLSFSPDGNTLLASSLRQPRTLSLWDIDVQSWKVRACATSNRNFTRDEWTHQFGQTMSYSSVCPNLPESVAMATIEAQVQAAVHEAENLLQGGKFKEAAAAYMKVLKFRPAATIGPLKWNNLCWLGSVNGHVKDVMQSCDYAAALRPD